MSQLNKKARAWAGGWAQRSFPELHIIHPDAPDSRATQRSSLYEFETVRVETDLGLKVKPNVKNHQFNYQTLLLL